MKNLRLLLIGSGFLLAAMTTCFVDAWVVPRTAVVVVPHRHARSASALAFSDNNDNNSRIEFNDFEDDNNNQDDDTDNASIQASLQQQVKAQAEAQEQMIAQTVNQANWNVRGFSLDPFATTSESQQEDDNEEKTTITALAYDEERQWIVCGRSDGSIVVVSLPSSGTSDEVLATFGTTQLPQFTDQNTLEWTNQLKKQQSDSDGFELIAHITPFKEWTKPAVDKIALTPNHIYASHVGKGLVEVLEIMETDDKERIERTFLSDLMMGPPALLSTSTATNDVYSMDPLGMLAVWKDDSTELEIRGKLDLQEYAMGDVAVEAIGSIHIQSTYMDEYIYVGTDHGQVWVYDVSLLGTSPRPLQPLLRLKAFDDHVNVTAVASNGPGVLGSTTTTDQTTISLLAAGSNGMLKQFELIPKVVSEEDDTTTFTLEYWPKMPQQTIPNRPHVLQEEGGPVLTSIRPILRTNELIVATSLEDCFVWNVSDDSKKPVVELSGFTNLTSAIPTATTTHPNNNLMLLCNGMEHFVAIHDFSATADDEDFMESFDLTDE